MDRIARARSDEWFLMSLLSWLEDNVHNTDMWKVFAWMVRDELTKCQNIIKEDKRRIIDEC